MGCTAKTLRKCAPRAKRDQGLREGLTNSERERLKASERENRELKRANELLHKASTFFAQAELDRKPKWCVVFIDVPGTGYGVEPICKQLPITPSTYYEHTAREADPERLSPRVRHD